jgi:hypothetical protein
MGAIKENVPTKKAYKKGRSCRTAPAPFNRKYHRQSIQSKAIPKKRTHRYQQPDPIQITDTQTSLMQKKCIPLNTGSETDPTLFFTDYSMLSNMAFRELLLTVSIATPDTRTNAIVQLLDTEELLSFARQLAQLFARKNYLKLQVEQWTYYYDIGMNERIWVGRVSGTMAEVNSMPYTYGRSKALIEQRRTKYRQQFEKIDAEIEEHLKKGVTLLSDRDNIVLMIKSLIEKDQYHLRIEFERRRAMLIFDAKEHQYVHAFYNLQPRETEVSMHIFHCTHTSTSSKQIPFRFTQQRLFGQPPTMNTHYEPRWLY